MASARVRVCCLLVDAEPWSLEVGCEAVSCSLKLWLSRCERRSLLSMSRALMDTVSFSLALLVLRLADELLIFAFAGMQTCDDGVGSVDSAKEPLCAVVDFSASPLDPRRRIARCFQRLCRMTIVQMQTTRAPPNVPYARPLPSPSVSPVAITMALISAALDDRLIAMPSIVALNSSEAAAGFNASSRTRASLAWSLLSMTTSAVTRTDAGRAFTSTRSNDTDRNTARYLAN